MAIPEDPSERRKWMLQLWRVDYGARFSVFDVDDQPAPELEAWQQEIWEPYEPKPDHQGNCGPEIIRHLRWFEESKEFLDTRYQITIGPDLFFDCKAMQCQGNFSDEIPLEKERLWYIRALRIGAFIFDGKLGVGFSCRSLSCQREKCLLNLKRKTERFNRVDIYQLMQIFEGEKVMPRTQAIAEISKEFGVPLHGFGKPYFAVPKQSVYRQLKLYGKDIPVLIKNFSNLCKRSDTVYFDLKPPAGNTYKGYFFFPQAMITERTLNKVNSSAVVTYLYLWMLRAEQVQQNQFEFSLPKPMEMEKDTESRGFKISSRTIGRHIKQLKAAKMFVNFSGPI
jgi:hypothetical protein